jgi:NAD(P)-dependent dehydrogenase (short-subunit alcohol dehydrogenase family)
VYATSRRIETIAESSFPNVERLALDVTSDESVGKAIEHIIEKEGRLDVVVNNAGAIAAGASYELRS